VQVGLAVADLDAADHLIDHAAFFTRGHFEPEGVQVEEFGDELLTAEWEETKWLPWMAMSLCGPSSYIFHAVKVPDAGVLGEMSRLLNVLTFLFVLRVGILKS